MEDNMLPDAKQNKHKEGHTEAPPGQKVKSPRSWEKSLRQQEKIDALHTKEWRFDQQLTFLRRQSRLKSTEEHFYNADENNVVISNNNIL